MMNGVMNAVKDILPGMGNLGGMLGLGEENKNPDICQLHLKGSESFILKVLGRN